MGLIARGVEEAGFSTVFLGSCRDMMAQVKAPRSVFLDFPLGHQCGKPNDVELQTKILKDTLNFLAGAATPGEMLDLPYEWDSPFTWADFWRELTQMHEEIGTSMPEWKPKK
ncbi:MAG: hypothetical protein SV487_04600 [Thermodesulfobacteriota bacterium]|nr:hypothetical protein [Thermodesulfobacteriota bacterium]